MPYIHVAPKGKIGLTQLYSRFELPVEAQTSPLFPSMVEREAKRIARLTADKNALRGFRWRSDMPVEVDISELQLDLSKFSLAAVDNGKTEYSQNLIAFVVKMWFEAREVVTEEIIYDDDNEARADGFVKDIKDFEDDL